MANAKILERFKAASPGHQLSMVGLVLLSIGGVLALTWSTLLQTPYYPLFTEMRDIDAATVVAELDRQKIPYQLSEGGSTIKVPADKVDATRLAIMSQDLPLKGTVGFELFNKTDMGLTDFAQKINYQRALQGELARTIMTLDGVDTARVHLSLGEDRIFRDDRIPPKASVTVRMKNRLELTESTVQGIQHLIAAAVPQLDLANVVVLDEMGQELSTATTTNSNITPEEPAFEQMHAIAQYYKARIRYALQKEFPNIAIGVAVNVGKFPDYYGNAGADDSLPDWDPATRDFPLQMRLDPSPSLTGREAEIHSIASAAAGFNSSLGDTLSFGHIQAPPLPTPARPRNVAIKHYAANPAAPANQELSSSSVFIKSGLILIGIMAVGLVLLRRKKVAPLSPEDKLEFAALLQTTLEEKEGHVTSRP